MMLVPTQGGIVIILELPPHEVTVTRIIAFLVGNPYKLYKPLFATGSLGGGSWCPRGKIPNFAYGL